MLRELRRGIRNFESAGADSRKQDLIAGTQQVEVLCEESRFAECAGVLYALMSRLLSLRRSDTAQPAEALKKDSRVGAGMRMLEAMQAGAPDAVDVLLGLYFVHARGLRT